MDKKIQLTKEVHDKLKEKAEAEGTTPDELAAKIVTEKSGKSAEKRKPKHAEQNNGKAPFVNAYGFIHLNSKMMETIGAAKGTKTPLKIEVKESTLVISKA
jgi:hypothetical protein